MNPALVSMVLAGSPAEDLRARWVDYKREYVSADGRAIDFRNGSMTSSEGQAYGLVRALWMDDREAFDTMLGWTLQNLQGGEPAALPAWKWGMREGDWGVIDQQPAADADQFMIWALFGAAKKWKAPQYSEQASALLGRFWAEEVEEVAGAPVVLPGPWARGASLIQLNPSYFLPFIWRDFARLDPARPWQAMIDRAYVLLATCRGATGLAVDWCYVDRETGWPVPSPEEGKDAFGFEALRVPWMLAAEVIWHDERRAKALLGPYHRLMSWRPEATRIPGIIRVDGSAAVDWEYPGTYGVLLPLWSLRRPLAAERLREERLDTIRAAHGWGDRDDYYGQNWIWFGLALSQLGGTPA